jgi:ribosomal protein L37AE/L43A
MAPLPEIVVPYFVCPMCCHRRPVRKPLEEAWTCGNCGTTLDEGDIRVNKAES